MSKKEMWLMPPPRLMGRVYSIENERATNLASSEETGDEGVLVAVLLAAGAPADVLQLVEAN